MSLTMKSITPAEKHARMITRVSNALDRTSILDLSTRPKTQDTREKLSKWLDCAINTQDPIPHADQADVIWLETRQLIDHIGFRDERGCYRQYTRGGKLISVSSVPARIYHAPIEEQVKSYIYFKERNEIDRTAEFTDQELKDLAHKHEPTDTDKEKTLYLYLRAYQAKMQEIGQDFKRVQIMRYLYWRP
jgi:hypothetical protein